MWRDLIADAEALMPAIGEYELYEAKAGLRPMSPDNLPIIGRVSDRVVLATGHGRNGILMTPVTADATGRDLGRQPLGGGGKRHRRTIFTREGLSEVWMSELMGSPSTVRTASSTGR